MCRALRKKGIEVVLATTNDGIDVSEFGCEKEYKDLPAIFFPSQIGRSFKYSRPFATWLNRSVSDFDIVHIHAVFNHACIAAARACRRNRVPYIIRPLGTLDPWGMKQKSWRKGIFWRLAGNDMLGHAAAIHYTAVGEKQATEQSLGLNHGYVVALGVEPAGDGLSAGKILAREFPALMNSPYVLVLSRLLPTKGLDVFLSAFLSVIKHSEFSNWKLVMAGAGPADYVSALKRNVTAEGADDSVLFPGWLEGDRKIEVLAGASLLALPSYHENFGLCVMEALSFGIPVLVSPHVNLAPEIESAAAGWISEIDQQAISGKLTTIFASAEERTKRGAAARRLAQNFSWDEIANQLVSKYNSILRASHEWAHR